MNGKADAEPKDNERYWKKRHRKLRGSLRGVGHAKKSEGENLTLYAKKRRLIFSVLAANGMADRLDGLRVLDAGCGTGMLSELFYVLGARVTGIDVSKVALKEAALRCPDGDFRDGSLTDFTVAGERFDLIVCADVLYHLVDDANWSDAVRNLCGHGAPGALLVILDQLKTEPQRPANHVRFRTRAMYDDLLLPRGAQPVGSGTAGTLVYRLPVAGAG